MFCGKKTKTYIILFWPQKAHDERFKGETWKHTRETNIYFIFRLN